jgi:hypothetical protein
VWSIGSGPKMIVFTASGAVKWSLPGYYPVLALEGGGLVASGPDGNNHMFDANGAATDQIGSVPTYSWNKQAYSQAYDSIAQIEVPSPRWAASYAATPGGNPSGIESDARTFIGVFESALGSLSAVLPKRGGSCDATNPQNTFQTLVDYPGGTQNRTIYDNLLDSLRGTNPATGVGYLDVSSPGPVPSCSDFFEHWEQGELRISPGVQPIRAGYFATLKDDVGTRVVYDGSKSTISLWDAGMFNPRNSIPPVALQYLQNSPVCGQFVKVPNTRAAAQIAPKPGTQSTAVTDIYMNTDPKSVPLWTEGTILHETLHNLTRLEDFVGTDARANELPPFDLQTFVGSQITVGVDAFNGSSIGITHKLVVKGCAPK